MINLQTAITLLTVGWLGTACAATNEEHAHQHSATGQGQKVMKQDSSTMAGKPTAGKAPVMLADGKAAVEMSSGQVKRINKGSKKITIKHGEIKSLDMPPMTMVFRVADEAMLDAVKKGDDVMFNVVDKDGAMVITKIEPVK